MKATTDTATGIHSPLTTSTERRFIDHAPFSCIYSAVNLNTNRFLIDSIVGMAQESTKDEILLINFLGADQVKTINVKTPNGIRSHFIYPPEKYAELCESKNTIKSEDVDKVVYNGFEFENTVDHEGN